MMRIFTLSSLAILPFVALAQRAASQTPSRTLITDVYIVSPESLDRVEKGSVLIENGHIVRVERGKQQAIIPAHVTVVPGAGRFLIPGLIDSHVHLAFVPGVRPEVSFGPVEGRPAMVREYFKQLPRSYLYFGYTTLIDPAVVDRELLDDIRRAPDHPDVYDCGQSLPLANGYPMALAPPGMSFTLYPNFIYDAQQASGIPPQFKPQDHTPAAAVAAVKRAGGICVKTYFDRGYGNVNLPVMAPDVLADIRKAATDAGLPLMIHANSFEAQTFAVAGDVDVIAHGMWNWGNLSGQVEVPTVIKNLLDRIAQRRIGYQPTMQVMQGFRAYFDPGYLHLKAIPKVIPADMVDWCNSSDGNWFKKELAPANTPDAVMVQAYDQGPLRRVRGVVAYLASRDANFLFGTDTPAAPSYGNLPGLNGFLEMKQLQKAGWSLVQIFKAATINNAREFKLGSQLGTIEPGKIANLVLLERSPLESIDAYDSIVSIWVHGKPVSRSSLAADSNK
jgi:imidazolonepropionase-like amidohydrolase